MTGKINQDINSILPDQCFQLFHSQVGNITIGISITGQFLSQFIGMRKGVVQKYFNILLVM